jgi:hypothetical protein
MGDIPAFGLTSGVGIFAVCADQDSSVALALFGEGADVNISLRRALNHQGLVQWNLLCEEVEGVTMSQGSDLVLWQLEDSGVFSVRSLYAKLAQGATVAHAKDLWRAAVP